MKSRIFFFALMLGLFSLNACNNVPSPENVNDEIPSNDEGDFLSATWIPEEANDKLLKGEFSFRQEWDWLSTFVDDDGIQRITINFDAVTYILTPDGIATWKSEEGDASIQLHGDAADRKSLRLLLSYLGEDKGKYAISEGGDYPLSHYYFKGDYEMEHHKAGAKYEVSLTGDNQLEKLKQFESYGMDLGYSSPVFFLRGPENGKEVFVIEDTTKEGFKLYELKNEEEAMEPDVELEKGDLAFTFVKK